MFTMAIFLVVGGALWAVLDYLNDPVGPIVDDPEDDGPSIWDSPAGAQAAMLTGISALAGLSVREAVKEMIWFVQNL